MNQAPTTAQGCQPIETGPEATNAKQARASLMAVWRDVKAEAFTKEDWIDLHRTINQFKARVVRRYQETR